MNKITPGTAVHFFSAAGPCLPATVVRENRVTYTLSFFGSKQMESKSLVHTETCPSCPGPDGQYPDGYMD